MVWQGEGEHPGYETPNVRLLWEQRGSTDILRALLLPVQHSEPSCRCAFHVVRSRTNQDGAGLKEATMGKWKRSQTPGNEDLALQAAWRRVWSGSCHLVVIFSDQIHFPEKLASNPKILKMKSLNFVHLALEMSPYLMGPSQLKPCKVSAVSDT